MSNKVIVIFVEGQTEYVFYSKICSHIQNIDKKTNKVIIKNLKGIGKFEYKAYSILKNEIIPKHKKKEIIVFCCYDSDAFNIPFQAKPPVDWNKVENKIKTLNISTIHHIKADESIEDWFLLDIDGLCNFLKIKRPKKVKGKNGYYKIKELFRTANKIYQKGFNASNFVDNLDYDKLLDSLKTKLSELR